MAFILGAVSKSVEISQKKGKWSAVKYIVALAEVQIINGKTYQGTCQIVFILFIYFFFN